LAPPRPSRRSRPDQLDPGQLPEGLLHRRRLPARLFPRAGRRRRWDPRRARGEERAGAGVTRFAVPARATDPSRQPPFGKAIPRCEEFPPPDLRLEPRVRRRPGAGRIGLGRRSAPERPRRRLAGRELPQAPPLPRPGKPRRGAAAGPGLRAVRPWRHFRRVPGGAAHPDRRQRPASLPLRPRGPRGPFVQHLGEVIEAGPDSPTDGPREPRSPLPGPAGRAGRVGQGPNAPPPRKPRGQPGATPANPPPVTTRPPWPEPPPPSSTEPSYTASVIYQAAVGSTIAKSDIDELVRILATQSRLRPGGPKVFFPELVERVDPLVR